MGINLASNQLDSQVVLRVDDEGEARDCPNKVMMRMTMIRGG